MKILTLHSNWIKVKPVKRAVKNAEEVPEDYSLEGKEALVVFTAIEKGDNENTVDNAVKEIMKTVDQVKAKEIIVYPYAHLSSNLSDLDTAKKLFLLLSEKLGAKHAPFGWYKQFDISVKGHPLAELSKEIKATENLEEKRHGLKKNFYIMDVDGKLYNVDEYNFKPGEEEFKTLVEKEALGKELPSKGEPEYIKVMKKFGFDWEPASDVGHMRYGPQATLMFNLVSDYVRDLVSKFEFPVYEVRGTNLFNVRLPAIAEHAKLFGDRLYSLEAGNKEFIMRYAACHQQFSMIKDWILSYKNLPFGAFEIADSYRLEQSGEVVFAFRLRRFFMPDMHVFCKDKKQAKELFMTIHKKIYDEIEKLGREYWDLYNVTEEFLEENKDWIHELVKYKGKPVLISTVPQGEFYWTINIEYHIIDKTGTPREIGTVQMDIGNAKRFDIKYTNHEGKQKHPVILHTAIIGGIERYLYALFDTALHKKNPTLPLWITPTQVRLCPVKDKHLDKAKEILDILEKENIRVDVDDRNETIPKKVRDAEEEWVPYIVVIGDKEIEKGVLAVRTRETGEVKEMKAEDLIEEIKERTKGYPFRPLNNAKFISVRPHF